MKPMLGGAVTQATQEWLLFSEFTQELIKTFDGERSEENRPTSLWEEVSTSAIIALREQPSTPAVGAAMTWEEEALASIQEVLASHQGMGRFPLLLIAANISKYCGNMSSSSPGSNIIAEIEQQDCTVLWKLGRFKGEMNHQPHVSLMSYTKTLRLECEFLEDGVNFAPKKFM